MMSDNVTYHDLKTNTIKLRNEVIQLRNGQWWRKSRRWKRWIKIRKWRNKENLPKLSGGTTKKRKNQF